MFRLLTSCLALALILVSCSQDPKTKNKKANQAETKEVLEADIKEPTLKEQIDEYAEIAKEKLAPAQKEIMISATNKLKKSDMAEKFYKVGDKAPDFELDSFDGIEYGLDDMLENGPVVVSFIRGGWCPYCNLELRALNDKYDEIRAKGAQLVVISPEIPERSVFLANKRALKFPILFDEDLHVAKDYNLVFKLDDSLKTIYKNFGINLETINDNDDWILPVPATYIIGPDRIIRFAYADVDYKNRAEPADIVEAL